MPYTTIGDIQLYHERQGEGPRLLYISGTGGDLRNAPRVFDGPLASHFDVLSYDQRGLGQSGKPDRPYSMAEYGDDAAALLDAVGWDRCLVMGVSFGGMVAQELALRHPKRIERLVLCCTSSGGAGRSSYPLHEIQHLPIEERAVFQMSISDLLKDDRWQAANPDDVAVAIAQAVAADRRRQEDPESLAGYRRQLEARRDHDTYERLGLLQVPVFLAGGRHDRQAPPENMEALRDLIPRSRLEFFEGGHGFTREDARALQRITAFLKGELDD